MVSAISGLTCCHKIPLTQTCSTMVVLGCLNSLQSTHSMAKPWADWNIYQFLFPVVLDPTPQENGRVSCLRGLAQCLISNYMQNGAKCNFLSMYILWAVLKIMVSFTKISIHGIILSVSETINHWKIIEKNFFLSLSLYRTNYSVSWHGSSTFLL